MKYNKNHISLAFLFVAVLLTPLNMFAQVQLDGQILNKHNGEAVAGAHIVLAEQNKTLISDQDGRFSANLSQVSEPIHISVSHVSFALFRKAFTLSELRGQLLIELNPSSGHLQPVSVVAFRSNHDAVMRQDVSEVVFKPIDSGYFLREAPNVSGVRRGGFGLDPVVRGNATSRLNIRVDGLTSSAAACPNRMDPPTSHIRLSDIERIEVHHGPHALQFGPAFGGTINFIRQQPPVFDGRIISGDVRTGFESNTGRQIADARVLLQQNRWNVMLSGGLADASNYTSGDGSRVNSSFASYDYGINVGYSIDQNHHLKASWTQSFVRDADFPALGMDMGIDDTYKATFGYRWENPGQSFSLFSADAYYTYVDHEMNNHNRESFQMRDAVALAETHSSGFQAKAGGNFGLGSWNVIGSLDHVAIDGTRFVDFKMGPNAGNSMQYNLWQDAYTTNAGLFAGADYNFENWLISLGSRLDYNTANARNPAPRFQNQDLTSEYVNLSFSAGLSRILSPQSSVSLYLGRGVRSPDVTERFINFLAIGRNAFEFAGNPNLKPEANNQADLVFDTQLSSFNLKLSGFVGYTSDYISAVVTPDIDPVGMNAPGVREFRNRGNVIKTGFEAGLGYRLSDRFRAGWQGSYTFAEYTDTGAAVAEIPPFEQTLTVEGIIGNRFSPVLSLRHVAAQNRIDESFGEMDTDAFFLVDFYTGISLLHGLDLTAGVRNLFDENYEEHLNRNFNPEFDADRGKLFEPGRRVFIELAYRF